MKKNVPLIFALLFVSLLSRAQNPELWGIASNNGAGDGGTIFKIYGDGSGFDTACSLTSPNGSFPGGHLVLNGDGLFYGTAFNGGTKNAGALFSINPVTNVYTKLYNLDSMGYAWTNSDLLRANDSTLYGAKYQPGEGPYTGRLFRFNPLNNSYTTIYSFPDSMQGQNPYNISLASDGLIYGGALGGGQQRAGALFSFDPATGAYTDVHDFDSTAGIYSNGVLTEAASGLLYGLGTGYSGNHGTIFTLDRSTYDYTTVFTFDSATSGKPSWNNGLIKGMDNKFYGMTIYGGANGYGVIFSFNPVGNIYKKLYDLTENGGTNPISTLLQASDGKLYGTTNDGGANFGGTVFRFNLTDSTYTVLKDLSPAIGRSSYGGLTELAPLTGIKEQAISNIEIYPNPSTDELRIRSDEHYTTYAIYTITGAFIRSATLPVSGAISLAGIPTGTYLLETKNKSTAARKVFVVK